jgi:hypothetical protein
MAITQAQRVAANQQQLQAAQDGSPQVRLIAGPGTGKSRTVEKRVAHVLSQGANPRNVYVISFTRATCVELSGRVRRYCSEQIPPINAQHVHISTMHSLALKMLRMGNQLNQFPSEPVMLDDWEQQNIYDRELAAGGIFPFLGKPRTRIVSQARLPRSDAARSLTATGCCGRCASNLPKVIKSAASSSAARTLRHAPSAMKSAADGERSPRRSHRQRQPRGAKQLS